MGIVELLPSAARTADTTAEASSQGATGAHIVIDVTAVAATPSVTFTVRGVDPSGKTFDILSSAAVNSVSTTVLKIHPGLTGAANQVANDMLPPQFEVFCDHADADSITYSVYAHLVA